MMLDTALVFVFIFVINNSVFTRDGATWNPQLYLPELKRDVNRASKRKASSVLCLKQISQKQVKLFWITLCLRQLKNKFTGSNQLPRKIGQPVYISAKPFHMLCDCTQSYLVKVPKIPHVQHSYINTPYNPSLTDLQDTTSWFHPNSFPVNFSNSIQCFLPW
jgi:hypothetical protein